MNAPRLEVDLAALEGNARRLSAWCRSKGIALTAVTKGVCGSPRIAAALVAGGIRSLGDSRLDNLVRMRQAGVKAEYILIRPPRPSMAARVVALADVSLNSAPTTIRALSQEALRQGKTHAVILMVELGDLREGIMPQRLPEAVDAVLSLKGVSLRGIGANMTCLNGVVPTAAKMRELGRLAEVVESQFGLRLACVSGGNSANLTWLAEAESPGRVNHLRIGEAILLGRETVHHRRALDLATHAFRLVGEVIEVGTKPARPYGQLAPTPFGVRHSPPKRGLMRRAIVALGEQDADIHTLVPRAPVEVLSACSDQLVLHDLRAGLHVGDEVAFDIGYRTLMRAMTSPYVAKEYVGAPGQGAERR